MATNALGYPYPVSTDPVAAGAANIKALADAILAKLGVQCRGFVNVTVSTANVVAVAAISFPPGLFTVAPTVIAVPRTTVPQAVRVSAAAPTFHGANVYVTYTGTGVITVDWLAVQV